MNVKLVLAALQLDDVANHYQVEFTPAEAREFAVGERVLAELLENIDKLIPLMNYPPIDGHENANNGKPHHVYKIGKEYSRVLYTEIRKMYLNGSGGPEFDYKWLTGQLKLLAKAAGAKEFEVVKETETVYRFKMWWD